MLAQTAGPGCARCASAPVDPSALDTTRSAFASAPRSNAAGRLYRADAGLELMLTATRRAPPRSATARPRQRRAPSLERRVRWSARRPGGGGDQAAYVLARDGWHPGVISIVTSRITEQAMTVVLVALDGDQGAGSRARPGLRLLGGLDPAAGHLIRHGGHGPPAAAPCAATRSTRPRGVRRHAERRSTARPHAR